MEGNRGRPRGHSSEASAGLAGTSPARVCPEGPVTVHRAFSCIIANQGNGGLGFITRNRLSERCPSRAPRARSHREGPALLAAGRSPGTWNHVARSSKPQPPSLRLRLSLDISVLL